MGLLNMSFTRKTRLDVLVHDDRKWMLIKEYTTLLSHTKNIQHFINNYKEYTIKFRFYNKNVPKNYTPPDLESLITVLKTSDNFFSEILPYICRLVQNSRNILPNENYLLDSYSNPEVKYNQLQCATLLAMMFIGLFP